MSRSILVSFITIAIAAILAPAAIAEAQPSDRQIVRDLRRAFPDATDVRIRPDAQGVEQTGARSWECQQMVEVVTRTDAFPGVATARAVSYGGAIFTSTDRRRWRYQRMTTGETTYEGVPTPTLEELIAYLESNRYDDFFQYENYILGLPALTVPEDDPRYGCYWHSPTRLECTVKATIDMRRGSSVARMPRFVRITLYAQAGEPGFGITRYQTSWSDDPEGEVERLDLTPEMEARGRLPDILEAMGQEESQGEG